MKKAITKMSYSVVVSLLFCKLIDDERAHANNKKNKNS